MRTPDDRIAELMAGALAGELTAAENDEWEALRRRRPDIDEEFRALAALSSRLREGDIAWTPPRDTESLRSRVLSAVDVESREGAASPERPLGTSRRARRWVTPMLSAACLAVGLAMGLAWPDQADPVPSGPPGTLGAIEPVTLDGAPDTVDIDADLVAHTWGTETVLEVTGLVVGSTYEVVLIDDAGAEYTAGAMLGSEVPIECRLNAAVLRPDAVRLEIRNTDDSVLAVADLPEV